MEYIELPPPSFLRDVVRCFWFLRGNGAGAEAQVVVPDGRSEIVLHLGEPFAALRPDGVARRQSRALAAGQLLGPLMLSPSGEADVMGIRFRTAAGNAVLGGAVRELTGQVAPLAEVAADVEARLIDAAARTPTPAERVAAVSIALARVIRRPPDSLSRAAVRALSQPPPDSTRVDRVARGLGVTLRTLERRLRDATGLSPRALRGVIRFRSAFRRLDGMPPGSWARVAVECGYFDQAHLTRDFRRFAGAPPSRFFQRDLELARAFARGDD
jgi:AraC-like DNA-binding protein